MHLILQILEILIFEISNKISHILLRQFSSDSGCSNFTGKYHMGIYAISRGFYACNVAIWNVTWRRCRVSSGFRSTAHVHRPFSLGISTGEVERTLTVRLSSPIIFYPEYRIDLFSSDEFRVANSIGRFRNVIGKGGNERVRRERWRGNGARGEAPHAGGDR